MVILLCSNPKRGVVAVVNYEPPSSESCEKWNSSDESLASTPTSGYNSGYPFVINCRFIKKFFSFPKTCNSCNKLVIGAGFSCRNCHFRCHKRCAIVIDENKEPRLKSKMCSLSRLPPESNAFCLSVCADFFARLFDSSKQWKRNDDLFSPEDMQKCRSKKLQVADNERSLDSCSGNALNQSRPGPTVPANNLSGDGFGFAQSQRPSLSSCTTQSLTSGPHFNKEADDKSQPTAFNQLLFTEQLKKVKRLHDDNLIQANNQHQSNDRHKAENDAKLSSARSPSSHLHINSKVLNNKVEHRRRLLSHMLACNCITCGTRVNTAQNKSTLATAGRKATYCNSEDRGNRRSLANHTSDLNEWTIPFEDLKFEQCILHSQSITVFKGEWHGPVMINVFPLQRDGSNLATFLDDVHALNKIRHENIALFMAVSIEPPHLAIVTCLNKGISLYQALHVENVRPFSEQQKLNIAGQIAQGMSYLHARGVTLKTLSSKNVMLESKVKISMLDYGVAPSKYDRCNKGCTRRGNLTYLSPELLRGLHVQPPTVVLHSVQTEQSDVYAFGTLVYEIFTSTFPYEDLTSEELIWSVCSGKMANLDALRGQTILQNLCHKCWTFDRFERPSFPTVLQMLHHHTNNILSKTNSSSMPNAIHLVGEMKTTTTIEFLQAFSSIALDKNRIRTDFAF
ncbi:Kinase suppressor of Ras 2 [Trichinella murrelli]|uniref:Kinase suppressor of Ras 2 n=1 Tax=Trichinella murrelli TaxID=144512 RepID=A0A0V0U7M3_9BILA|nr:Kinase suppressor of Ras 2 [Trichinella murrelli]